MYILKPIKQTQKMHYCLTKAMVVLFFIYKTSDRKNKILTVNTHRALIW